MLSHASKSIGTGWVFGLNEAMDQGGATLGPLIVALVLFLKGGYRHAFALLLIPALLCLGTLVIARLPRCCWSYSVVMLTEVLRIQKHSRIY
jgi:MFS family permease